MYLVGNKSDIYDNTAGSQAPEVSAEEGEKVAVEIGADAHCEVSAKTGEGIDSLFEDIALTLHECDNGEEADDHSFSLKRRKKNKPKNVFDDFNGKDLMDQDILNCACSKKSNGCCA